jgi:hypothetical protein
MKAYWSAGLSATPHSVDFNLRFLREPPSISATVTHFPPLEIIKYIPPAFSGLLSYEWHCFSRRARNRRTKQAGQGAIKRDFKDSHTLPSPFRSRVIIFPGY